jgi:cytidylate kinase
VEFVRIAVGNEVNVEEILEAARHDPDLDRAVDAYFQNFSSATPQSLSTVLDQAIHEYFSKWQPKGKPN